MGFGISVIAMMTMFLILVVVKKMNPVVFCGLIICVGLPICFAIGEGVTRFREADAAQKIQKSNGRIAKMVWHDFGEKGSEYQFLIEKSGERIYVSCPYFKECR